MAGPTINLGPGDKKSKRWINNLIKRVTKAMVLRQGLDTAEADLMYELMDFENAQNEWFCGTFPTFGTLLEKFHICSPNRYERFKKAAKILAEPVIRHIGVHGALEAAKIKDKKLRRLLIVALSQFRKDNNTVASRETAAKYRRDITGEATIPSPLHRHGKIQELKQEILRLEKVIKQLRKALETERETNAKLRKERNSLRRELAKCKKAKGRPKKKLTRGVKKK